MHYFLSIAATALIANAIAARGSPLPPSTLHWLRRAVKFHILVAGNDPVAGGGDLCTEAGGDHQGRDRRCKGVGYWRDQGFVATGHAGEQRVLPFVCECRKPTLGGDQNPELNLIRFTPIGLENGKMSAAAVAMLRQTGNIVDAFEFTATSLQKRNPQPLVGFTLVHEMVDQLAPRFAKVKGKKTPKEAGLQQCQSLAVDLKRQNPQNYAFFARFVGGLESRVFAPDCKVRTDKPLGARALDVIRGLHLRDPFERGRTVKAPTIKAKPVPKPIARKPAPKPLPKAPAAKAALKSAPKKQLPNPVPNLSPNPPPNSALNPRINFPPPNPSLIRLE
ncbi:hypothetical protein B0H13DRAFT_1918541 [Mycena leptocephala]|nr:hypothetical protein B0H13DRAFT_1918541 [Mycena leptocephala]